MFLCNFLTAVYPYVNSFSQWVPRKTLDFRMFLYSLMPSVISLFNLLPLVCAMKDRRCNLSSLYVLEISSLYDSSYNCLFFPLTLTFRYLHSLSFSLYSLYLHCIKLIFLLLGKFPILSTILEKEIHIGCLFITSFSISDGLFSVS